MTISLFILFFRYTDILQAIRQGEIDSVTSVFKDNITYALIVSLFIMIIQNSFTVIPLILVITLNFYSFGFFYGFLWSWLSSVIAAMIIFLAIRFWFQDFVHSKVKNHQDMLDKIEHKGMRYVIYGRVFPFFPTSILNIIAGVSNISLRPFTIGTAIGNFFYFFVLALIPYGVFSTNINPLALIVIILLITGIFYYFNRKKPSFMERVKEMKKRA
ncbi:TVP38/TMEM64 family protein [Niallia sp. FSL W8-0635]|uniref:TVP38/TMEM64 family protein n=1 Tax=Niallia sp. FSL W8-0635 TaxID=2975337 RepID=UPI0009C993DD|nr:TVP38/TMEM64 family inner membrane protein ydjZ [Mycobacteroides abscessus subsp. abscessus]HEO8418541.1 TVP38/TMEM64 family protein [Yersinia enterocolitica]HEO8422914.1 TVP38/TMEM64 family protein [Yersinia enterocolitica]